jgi:hypothetical protein
MRVEAIVSLLMMTAAAGVHAQNSPPAAEGFILSGVISVDGGGGFAWLQEPRLTNNQVVAVRRGETVGPYRLTEIFEDRVELEGPAGKLLVPLFNAQAAAPSQAVAASPSTPSAVASLRQLLRHPGQQQQPEGQVSPQEQAQNLQQQFQGSQERMQPTAQLIPQMQQQAQARQQIQTQMQQQATEHGVVAQPGTPPTPSTAASSLPAARANNPNILFVPMGDPRRAQGLGALTGLGQR